MNLLERAKRDLYIARSLITPYGNPTNDEGLYDIAAFHTQQAMEKSIKYILRDVYGMDDDTREFKTHNILILCKHFERLSGSPVPQEIRMQALELTGWEASSRYNQDSVATRDEIETMIEICDRYIADIERQYPVINSNEIDDIEPSIDDDDLEL